MRRGPEGARMSYTATSNSVKPTTREALLKATWVSTKNQEHSDLDKALAALVERGARCISVAGAMGRRADHALANIGCC